MNIRNLISATLVTALTAVVTGPLTAQSASASPVFSRPQPVAKCVSLGGGPNSAKAGEREWDFTTTADPDGAARSSLRYQYEWKSDYGTTRRFGKSSQASKRITFPRTGATYTVKVTVFNNGTTDTCTKVVRISKPTAPIQTNPGNTTKPDRPTTPDRPSRPAAPANNPAPANNDGDNGDDQVDNQDNDQNNNQNQDDQNNGSENTETDSPAETVTVSSRDDDNADDKKTAQPETLPVTGVAPAGIFGGISFLGYLVSLLKRKFIG